MKQIALPKLKFPLHTIYRKYAHILRKQSYIKENPYIRLVFNLVILERFGIHELSSLVY